VREVLLARREPARGRVVVGAEVQSADPPLPGRDEPRDGERARRVHYGLRGLDLDLEPQPTRRQAQPALQQGEQLAQHGHLLDGRHLRERQRQAGRHLDQVRQEQVQRADPAGEVLERLEADAHPRRHEAHPADHAGGPHRVLVLVGVGLVAVAVLEVDPQVLHRLGGELRHDLLVHRLRQRGWQSQHLGERQRAGRVLLQRGERGGAPLDRQVGGQRVGRDVAGVHGLAAARVTRVPGRALGVHFGQPSRDPGERRRVQGGPHPRSARTPAR
jgi:hypothetical protein